MAGTVATSVQLVFITPHRPGAAIPTRPAALLDALVSTGAFDRVTVVSRLRPAQVLRRPRSSATTIEGRTTLVEHPWPFGRPEQWFLRRLVRSIPEPRVIWIADPKAGLLLRELRGPGTIGILDAYDAWDRSPLVVGNRRRRAVLAGYLAAASGARLVFANTREMARRLQDMGARDVRHLPNAGPPVQPWEPASEPYLVYVGRIHERFDSSLVSAVADRLPAVPIVIAGPLERQPAGWPELVEHPNVRLEGPLPAERALRLIGGSRGLLIPHAADDYTRSQDAMKAWDALSVGAPVLSTSVPPADEWGEPLAIRADEPEAFARGAARLVAGDLDRGRAERLRYAGENTWTHRAGTAMAAIREVAGWP